jgi:protein-tyrosine phosphatase
METALKRKTYAHIKTAHNLRDLGGHVTERGETTSERFLRADCFAPLSKSDALHLFNDGVRTVIDLRNRIERQKIPCAFCDFNGVAYISLPLFPEETMSDIRKASDDFKMSMLYIDILERCGDAVRAFFAHCATVGSGRVLFHCSAGKDRTGVLSALLLKLAGVPDESIVEEYALTESNLKAFLSQLIETGAAPGASGALLDEMMSARPDNMRRTLAHINGRYGTVQSYLRAIGLSQENIRTVRDMMLKERN